MGNDPSQFITGKVTPSQIFITFGTSFIIHIDLEIYHILLGCCVNSF